MYKILFQKSFRKTEKFQLIFCLFILVLTPFFPFIGMEMMLNAPNSNNGEDLMTLEAEISDLVSLSLISQFYQPSEFLSFNFFRSAT